MAHYYLDSSALVKRYAAERGTAWIENLCEAAGGHAIYLVRVSGASGLPALTFVCADTDLNAAASAEGLLVDDPNAHP